MALTHGTKIVRDGLVLHLDAASVRSYPGSGTDWFDVSGNGYTGDVVNGTVYDSNNNGYFTFDGTNDHVQTDVNLTLSEATFTVWIRRDGNQTGFAGIFFSRGTQVTGINFRGTTNQLGYHWDNASNTYNFNTGILVPDQEWCYVAVSVASSQAVFYLFDSTGAFSATNTISHAPTIIDDLRVGRDSGSRHMKGNISVASLYNRALTQAEIQQNFNAMKGRYGL